MASDEDSTRPYQNKHGKVVGEACVQDRPIRDIQRDIRGIQARLNEGDTCMTRLECTLENLTTAVQETMTTTKELTVALRDMAGKPPAIGQKILDAFITWAVPAVIFMIFWVALNSGVINVPITKPAAPTTGAHP